MLKLYLGCSICAGFGNNEDGCDPHVRIVEDAVDAFIQAASRADHIINDHDTVAVTGRVAAKDTPPAVFREPVAAKMGRQSVMALQRHSSCGCKAYAMVGKTYDGVKLRVLLHQKLCKRLADRGLELTASAEAKEFLATNSFEAEFGARPLRRAIERNIEDPLAEEILRGRFRNVRGVKVELLDAKLVFLPWDPEQKAPARKRRKTAEKTK